jgi:FixJ family two-component response regulator
MRQPNQSIAVIDDEEQIRRALLRLLRSAGLAARAYASGQEFLAAWRSDPPTCIVLDLQMPGINGLDLMQCLNQLGAQLPVIMITAHDEPAMRTQCLQAGAFEYMCKPLDDQVLLDLIKRAQKLNPEN